MTERSPLRPSPGRAAFAVATAAPLAVAAGSALTETGRAIFATGTMLALATAVGRWRAAHGAATAVVLTLILQPALAVLLQPPIRHLIPDLSFVIRSDMEGIRDGAVVTVDERGFRPTSDPRPTEPSQRLVLVGGSTTEQLYVDDRATTGWLLADRLGGAASDTEVLNTGLSGLRARDHLNHIRHFAADAGDFRDTHLVIMLGINDWNRLASIHVFGDEVRPSRALWRDVDQYPVTRLAIAARVQRLRSDGAERRLEFPGRGSYETSAKSDVTPEQLERMLEDWRAALEELIAACDGAERLRCTFVTQPTVFTERNLADPDVRATISMNREVERALSPESLILVARMFNRTLVETVASSGCTACAIIDADTALAGDPVYFYDESHFTEAGAAALADALIQGGVLQG